MLEASDIKRSVKGKLADWLDNLEPQKKDTYDHLETAFKEGYIQPSVFRFRSACELSVKNCRRKHESFANTLEKGRCR